MTSGIVRLVESEHAIIKYNLCVFTLKRKSHDTKVLLSKGSIVKVVELGKNEILITKNDTDKTLNCDDQNIYRIPKPDSHFLIPIDSTIFQYLLAVPSPLKRLRICEHPIEYKKLVKLQKDQFVCLLSENNGKPQPGTIKFKGPIPELGNGYYFGLDLLNTPEDIQSNDGSIGGKSYFTSISNCGVFVSLDRLKALNNLNEASTRMSTTEKKCQRQESISQEKYKSSMVVQLKNKNSISALPSSHQEIRAEKVLDYDDHFTVGDRVVWKKGTERGCIREIKHNEALIEFDNLVDVPQNERLLEPLKYKSQNKIYLPLDELIKENFKNIHSYFENGNFTKNGKNTLSRSDTSKMHEQKNIHKEYEHLDYKLKENDNLTTTKSKKGRKSSTPLDSYPLGEAKPRDYLTGTEYPLSSKYNSGITRTINRSNESHIRHSYSQELHPPIKNSHHFSQDLVDNCNGYGKTSARSPKDIVESFTTLNFSDADDSNGTIPRVSLASTSKYLNDPNDHLNYLLEDPDNTPLTPHQSDLEVGSLVEVNLQENDTRYGVIRWLGPIGNLYIAGIEMEEEDNNYNDGTLHGRSFFQCAPKKGLFVNRKYCFKDSRFQDTITPPIEIKPNSLCQMDSQIIPGSIPPISFKDEICGKSRGIQGHHNSCYLDATLFSMFSFTSVFDSLLFRPPTSRDNAQYKEVQRVLREEIVNPLRKNYYVGANHVMQLRTLLEKFSSVRGLTSEEKDPEEFLTSLVAQILKAEPFLKLNSGQEAYHYQLFVEKNEDLTLPSVQQLFEQSFLTSDIKLKEVPSCLIIQMPRFGKSYKMYPRILPSQLLDVTDVIEDSPRQCIVCGNLAQYECKECFGQCKNYGLESISFCEKCLETAHCHQLRSNHKYRHLSVPVEFMVLQEHCPIPRLYMELFAVVCIETSHYVAFVKCGSGSQAPWVFFDSMADRKGEQNGYNIPEIVLCKDLPLWLSEEGANSLNEMKDRQLPEHAKRLLCDAYMCMYQSPDVMMYR